MGTEHGRSMLRSAIDTFISWSKTWQLDISLSKCTVLHLGRTNPAPSYSINQLELKPSSEALDLGVTMDSVLSFSIHIKNLVSKARQRSFLILRTFISRDPALLTKAFLTYVRPLLEYASPIWSPSYSTYIALIENVQRSFTKRLFGLSNLSYGARLNILNLKSLEERRLIIDLVTCYKIIHGMIELNPSDFFNFSPIVSTRGNSAKLKPAHCNTNVRLYYFNSRVIKYWNRLPDEIIKSASVASFSTKLSFIHFIDYE